MKKRSGQALLFLCNEKCTKIVRGNCAIYKKIENVHKNKETIIKYHCRTDNIVIKFYQEQEKIIKTISMMIEYKEDLI